MYGCESWTIKQAECWRIGAFELWCRKRLLRVLWSARRSNQSIVKEVNSRYSLKGLMLKLKLQYFGYLMWRPDSLDPDAVKDWRQEEKGITEDKIFGWHHQLNGHKLSKLQEMVNDREAWCSAVHRVPKNQTWLSDWTAISILGHFSFIHGHWNVFSQILKCFQINKNLLYFWQQRYILYFLSCLASTY